MRSIDFVFCISIVLLWIVVIINQIQDKTAYRNLKKLEELLSDEYDELQTKTQEVVNEIKEKVTEIENSIATKTKKSSKKSSATDDNESKE